MESHVCCPVRCKPEKLQYFSQICVEEFLNLPRCQPDIEQIVSVVADCEVVSLKVISTMKGLSYEGQNLTGKKLAIEIRLRQKLLYVSDKETQSVHVLENVCYQSCYIVIPCIIEGTDPELLIRHNLLKCKINVEDIFAKTIERRKVFKNICLLVIAELVPTYEICCAIDTCKASNIFLTYNDGTQINQITSCHAGKNTRPLWSPLGREFAYISENNCKKVLVIYSLKTCNESTLKLTSDFMSIGGISWMPDGTRLIFSGRRPSSREIYSVNTSDSDLKQLTYGNGKHESYKPKCSPFDGRIAFLRSSKGLADLWLMNGDGLDCIKLTCCGDIKYFDWAPDGKNIVYSSSHHDIPDQLFLFDIECMKSTEICPDIGITNKRKVKFSPDGQSIAFIGSRKYMDDIYTYHITEKKLENISENNSAMDIWDFVWSADSDRIYFSACDSLSCGVFKIEPGEKQKCQILSAQAVKIDLSYRGRIG